MRVLVPGRAEGELLYLEEPLSFWGGVDTESGRIQDTSHPQLGVSIAGRITVLPYSRGSTGTSSALTELIRSGKGPAGLILGETDMMLAVGSVAAFRLYGVQCPIVVGSVPRESSGCWRIEGGVVERCSA